MRKRKNKWLSMLLICTLIITMFPTNEAMAASGWTGEYDTEWFTENVKELTYCIYTADDLAGLAYLVNNGTDFMGCTIYLMNNIDISGYDWTPIGEGISGYGTKEFNGTFDGRGYNIDGLTISNTDDNSTGLFGYTGLKAVIKNLGINNADITGMYCGGLVGYNQGIIQNCYAISTITADRYSSYLGGLVGTNYYGSIINSYAVAEVSGNCYMMDAGGLVGMSYYGTVTNSYAVAEVSGNAEYEVNIGGLIGENYINTVINCYSTAVVSGSGEQVNIGGFAGYSYCSNVTNCYYNKNNIKGIGDNRYNTLINLTGLSAEVMKGAAPSEGISYLTSDGSLTTGTDEGAFLQAMNGGISMVPSENNPFSWVSDHSLNGGYPVLSVIQSPEAELGLGSMVGTTKIEAIALEGNHFAIQLSASAIPAPVIGDKIESAVYYISGSDIEVDLNVHKYIALYELDSDDKAVRFLLLTLTENEVRSGESLAGDGTKSCPYKISSEADLLYVADTVNGGNSYQDKYFLVTGNIELTGQWTPIGNIDNHFSGTFDGGGYRITGVKLGTADAPAIITYTGFFGYIDSNAVIQELEVSINMYSESSENIGGLVGYNYYGSVINCYTTVNITDITKGRYIGGLVGNNHNGKIINSYSTGEIYSGDIPYAVGGLVGINYYGTVTNCYSADIISCGSSDSVAKGLIGYNCLGNVQNGYYNSDLYDSGMYCNYPQEDDLIGLATSKMKDLSFAKTLNINAGNIIGAKFWLINPDSDNGGYPELTASAVVTSVQVNSEGNTSVINKGDALQMSTILSPVDAACTAIYWSVSDETLADISEDGILTAKGVGTVTVTATVASGYSGNKEISIYSGEVERVVLNREKLVMSVSGAAVTLTATVLPTHTTYKEVNWTVSGPAIALVEAGIIVPVTTGSAIIIATTKDGGKTATCELTINNNKLININNITADNGKITITLNEAPNADPKAEDFVTTRSINSGSPVQLSIYDFTWDNAKKTVQYSIDPVSVSLQDQLVEITIDYQGDVVKSIYSINASLATAVEVNSLAGISKIKIGDTLQMIATAYPEDTLDHSITWSVINDSGSAVINSDGLLQGITEGIVTVKATANDGSGVYGTKSIRIYKESTYVPDQSNPGNSDTDTEDASEDNGTAFGARDEDCIFISLTSDQLASMQTTGNITVSMEELNKLLENVELTHISIMIQLPQGGSGDYDLNSGLKLSADVLEAIQKAGKGLIVTVKGNDEKELFCWVFDADSITRSDQPIEVVNLYIGRTSLEYADELRALLNGRTSGGLVLSFMHEGLLPGQAKVKIYVGNQPEFKEGTKIYLYHYNRSTFRLETLPFSSEYAVDSEGYITINLVHCSDYVVLTKGAATDSITSLRNQITVTPVSKTLYIGGDTNDSTQITIRLPSTLELLTSLEDTKKQSAIGGVTAAYSSNNEKVAVVDPDGRITAVGVGKAVITTTLKLYNGKIKKVKTSIIVKEAERISPKGLK